MEGFLNWKISPFIRRIFTRAVAIVPALIVAAVGGSSATNQMLVISQVILSFQLAFAVFPLVILTSDAAKMGQGFVNGVVTKVLGYAIAVFISLLNLWMISQTIIDSVTGTAE